MPCTHPAESNKNESSISRVIEQLRFVIFLFSLRVKSFHRNGRRPETESTPCKAKGVELFFH